MFAVEFKMCHNIYCTVLQFIYRNTYMKPLFKNHVIFAKRFFFSTREKSSQQENKNMQAKTEQDIKLLKNILVSNNEHV